MPTILTQTKRLSDGIQFELHPAICRVSGTFRNASGSTIAAGADLLFQPVKLSTGKWVPVLATDEANATGLALIQGPVAQLATSTDMAGKVAILKKGPLVFNKTSLPAADVAGTSFTIATLVTALEAFGFTFVTEPTTVETQTK